MISVTALCDRRHAVIMAAEKTNDRTRMWLAPDLVLSNPTVRRYLGQVGLGNFASAALPDLERYFRLGSM